MTRVRREPKASDPAVVRVQRQGRGTGRANFTEELERVVEDVEAMRIKQGYAPSQEDYDDDQEI
ncbi:hypothetical protein C4L39_26305 [Clostridium diolis]|uniref:hypothetical protein n=1 Tax=Clostridium diolis TaxID=223919 RepID=UPI000D139743|nr:hypothetical protein [Clostridium diolis]PSM54806.1 hypothetical protein C4L39_26305 [Clostridium diolis]